MNRKKAALTVVTCILLKICIVSNAQNEKLFPPPKIGKPVPDFVSSNVKYYAKTKISKKELEGKWVVLDFFSKECSSCFASFPRINELRSKFKDRLEIFLIGDNRRSDGIENVFERFRNKLKLELPVSYEAKIFDDWKIRYVPHLIWIDSSGIVKAVTNSSDLTVENIQLFLAGMEFPFSDRSVDGITTIFESYTYNKPLLVDGNGGSEDDLLYRSLLTAWKPDIKQSVPETISGFLTYVSPNRFQVTGSLLEWLYEFAYVGKSLDITSEYGTIYHLPVLKIRDTSLFCDYDFKSGKYLFSYSVSVPLEKANKELIMKIMRKDLALYFGYEAVFENSIVPCWVLKAKDNFKNDLLSRSEKEVVEGSHSGYLLKHVSIQRIIQLIAGYHQQEPPLINETGIDFNIDIEIDALMTDLNDIKRALAEHGLILERGLREMPAIVIRDSKE